MSSRSEIIYGIHAVRATLEAAPESVLEIWFQAGTRNPALSPIAATVEKLGLVPQSVPRASLDRMSAQGRHQGVVARCRPRPVAGLDLHDLLAQDQSDALYLVLDSVEDPRNLGACLRVADSAGVRAVIRPMHRGTGLTAAATKVASGAAESVPLVSVNNLARALADMQQAGIWLVGTDAEASCSIYEVDMNVPLALVLGAEGKGLRRLTRERCDTLASIPMYGSVESLNVAVSAGVCLYEAVRQRRASRR